MTKAVIAQFEEYDRKIFWALIGVGAITLTLYLYFLSISVVAVVARKEAELEIGRTGTRVAQLESTYATLDRSIDLAIAHETGYIDVVTPQYISLNNPESSLTLRSPNDVVH